ncbi:hypothetical protein Taro_018497 [Colocasia esculenta]|uniref:Hexosyltransferase n=1 Tax=Colocasia esculenta TaxID=4460 RepID=A0A843UWE0_COLES|nr:hypothetical protein [Colocasia esculenta]
MSTSYDVFIAITFHLLFLALRAIDCTTIFVDNSCSTFVPSRQGYAEQASTVVGELALPSHPTFVEPPPCRSIKSLVLTTDPAEDPAAAATGPSPGLVAGTFFGTCFAKPNSRPIRIRQPPPTCGPHLYDRGSPTDTGAERLLFLTLHRLPRNISPLCPCFHLCIRRHLPASPERGWSRNRARRAQSGRGERSPPCSSEEERRREAFFSYGCCSLPLLPSFVTRRDLGGWVLAFGVISASVTGTSARRGVLRRTAPTLSPSGLFSAKVSGFLSLQREMSDLRSCFRLLSRDRDERIYECFSWACGGQASIDRFTGLGDDSGKRRSQRSRDLKDADRSLVQERVSSGKLHSLKLIFIIIVCGTFLTLLFSPAINQNEHHLSYGSRSRFVDVGWIWERTAVDSRYVTHLDVDWTNVSKAIEKLGGRRKHLKVGLLNFNVTETNNWQQLLPRSETHVIQLDYVDPNLTWETLYPEWIDEEEESEVPVCPSLPEPKVLKQIQLDVIAVKLPCNRTGNWSRDVARLHLQLAAAKLASAAAEGHNVNVLLVTDCFPTPNLLKCKDLVTREGTIWLYRPNIGTLRENVRLPVGSCQLSVPLRAKARLYSEAVHREAYATILHSAHVYVCGAIAAAQSIRMSGSKRDLVILVDETISDHHRSGLEAAGWKIRTIQRIRNPKAEHDAYNEWNYSKFRLWQLTDYDKVIFIDADLLILRNIDFLFAMPEITATGNNATLFNSGVMVVEPSNCTFQLLMDHINEIESYNGGDQGYLNEIFTWWHRIPKHMNFLKHFWVGDEEEKKQMKVRLFGADPPVLYVLHYLGLKPWLCFRDYDCNWNVDILQEFASDIAHARWWRVHDAMPDNLQSFCLLRSKQKAALEWDRRQAEKANYSDGHWKKNITDPRLNICFEEFCFWESMLWHWGETNWTDNNPPPATPTASLPSL